VHEAWTVEGMIARKVQTTFGSRESGPEGRGSPDFEIGVSVRLKGRATPALARSGDEMTLHTGLSELEKIQCARAGEEKLAARSPASPRSHFRIFDALERARRLGRAPCPLKAASIRHRKPKWQT